MQPFDAADERLLAWLYNSTSIGHADIDRCVDDYQVARSRGQAITLAEIVVQQRLVSQEMLDSKSHSGSDADTGAYQVRRSRPNDPAAWVWSVLGVVALPALVLGGILLARGVRNMSPGTPRSAHRSAETDTTETALVTEDPAAEPSQRPGLPESPASGVDSAATQPPPLPLPSPIKVRAKQRLATPEDVSEEIERTLSQSDSDPVDRVLEIAAQTPPEAPAARRAKLERLRENGLRRLARARERIDQGHREKLARMTARHARVVQRSDKRPFPVTLAPGMPATTCRVTRYDAEGFTVQSVSDAGAVERDYPWYAAPTDVAVRVRALGTDPANALDLLDLGRFCLERRLFNRAARAFGDAVALDPKLQRILPNLDTVARVGTVFHGRFQRRGGGHIKLTYPFNQANELADFELRGATANLADGVAVLEGSGLFLAALKDIVFEDGVWVETSVHAGSQAQALLGVILEHGQGGGPHTSYLAFFSPSESEALLVYTDGSGNVHPLSKHIPVRRGGPRIRLTASSGRLGLWVNGKRVANSVVAPFRRVTVVLGGIQATGGRQVGFKQLEVRGRVSRQWMRKTFAEVDAIVARELDEDLLVERWLLEEDLRPEDTMRELFGPLSAEDDHGLEQATERARTALRTGRQFLRRGSDGLPGAWESFSESVQRSPWFAAARHMRAITARQLDDPLTSAFDAATACSLIEGFHEAHALLGIQLSDLGRDKEAIDAAERAIQMRPDSAFAHLVRGRALYLAGNLEASLESLDLAVALDPRRPDARGLRRNIRHVLRGPAWKRSFTTETDHYRVHSNISATRCRLYATQLEAIHDYYVRVFGEASGDRGREEVLIFDSAEGYHTYAELTLDDRVESTMGYYHEKYRQLLLYEDQDDLAGEETSRVLFHEGFHQFIHAHSPKMPYWLNEGLAEYFGASEVRDGRVVSSAGIQVSRLKELRLGLRLELGVPFEDLINQSPAEFYSGNVSLKYAQAWAMVHFFMHGRNGTLRPLLVRYLNALRRGASAADAFDVSFSQADLLALQREWLRYVDRMGK